MTGRITSPRMPFSSPGSSAPPAPHPLAPLSGDEIIAAREIVFASGKADVPNEALRFAYIGLFDPVQGRGARRRRRRAVAIDRQVRIVLLQGPVADVVEVTVSVTRGVVDRWEHVRDVRPPLQMEESILVLAALHEHPDWNAALERRGIVDTSLVQIDPWPAGTFGLGHEEGRRITRCLAYLRESKEDNGYARPLEGLLAFVDMGRGEVLEVVDYGIVPVPPTSGSYYAEHNEPMRTDLKPLEIVQPEGPSFQVDGNLVRWQKWSMRVGMDPLEGLVLWTVGYEDGGRIRPVVYRASVSEMVVPYGHPGPMHAWKSAFDAGEWGLGRMANSLTLGCDCLGEIFYFDDVFADERGKPRTRANAICMHEEDYGILWKHVDMVSGRTEVRRSRRLVVSSIATVGNYEYGFYWYFYLDGTMQLEVKLTGIMSTMAVADGDAGDARTHDRARPGRAVPPAHVQRPARHAGRRPRQRGLRSRCRARGQPGQRREPLGQCLRDHDDAARKRVGARRDVDPSRSRTWRIANRSRHNGLGQPTAYKLLPGSTPTLLADPTSSVGRRAAFASHNLWVTPFDPEERRAAGDYPNQHAGGAGLPRLDRPGPLHRRHRHRAVAFLRCHAHPAPRRLAGHAGRVHRVHARALRLLRPQPGARRASVGRALP